MCLILYLGIKDAVSLHRGLTEYLYSHRIDKKCPNTRYSKSRTKFSGSNNKGIWSGDIKTGHVPTSDSNNNLQNWNTPLQIVNTHLQCCAIYVSQNREMCKLMLQKEWYGTVQHDTTKTHDVICLSCVHVSPSKLETGHVCISIITNSKEISKYLKILTEDYLTDIITHYWITISNHLRSSIMFAATINMPI
jgi:hypothetical protein